MLTPLQEAKAHFELCSIPSELDGAVLRAGPLRISYGGRFRVGSREYASIEDLVRVLYKTFSAQVKEAGYLFDGDGKVLYWHLPSNRMSGRLPDSQPLWDAIWGLRDRVVGFIHTHPWKGTAKPSYEDVTTWAAVEQGLGRRLLWPIATFDTLCWYAWSIDRLTYVEAVEPIVLPDIEQLRRVSGSLCERITSTSLPQSQ